MSKSAAASLSRVVQAFYAIALCTSRFLRIFKKVEIGACATRGVHVIYFLADADVAQLVEHDLAKVGVAGSNPVVRSITCKAR